MATTQQLAAVRRRNAVLTVQYDGKTVKVDPNMRTMLGVLRSIPGLETKAFAEAAGITFEQGPQNRVPACPGKVCKCSKNQPAWFGFWGNGDPRRVAAKLQRFLLEN